MSLILAWSHTFVEFDHEIVSTGILIVDPESMSLILAWSHTFVEFVYVIVHTGILLLLIQEGLCHLQAKGMCTKYWPTP